MATQDTIITREQFGILQGFFTHVWSSYFDGTTLDTTYWATYLDSKQISWRVQNTVSHLASERGNAFLYLRNLLAKQHITEQN